MSIDVPFLIGATNRQVRDVEREGRTARVVVATRTYDTSIEDLWDAITNGERLPRWFLPIEGDLRLGGKYQFKGNAGGTITRCEPPRELAATWEMMGGVSWVEVSLRPDGDGARLELKHTAYPEAHWEQFGAGAVGIGWELGLMGLGIHIANPNATEKPPEADPAWAATDEAKAFMRASGAAWGEAEIANGEDAAPALERAERTVKFYTGEA
jgi:uncharacterized protein YndB with AHSA1/START domain